MFKGTTPTFIISLCSELDLNEDTSEIWVTVKDSSGSLLNKTKSELTIEDNKLLVYLTQAETNAFASGKAMLQVRILTTGGKALASKIAEFDVDDVLKSGVIS